MLDSCRWLEQDGFEVTYLPVQQNGLIDLEELKATIRPDTVLVSVMGVNNEIGVVQPLAEIGALRGRQAARESGEGGERACGALELLQLRQRMSVRIWSSYQRYICARVQYADPTHDTQRQHAHHAEVAAAKQELQAQRHINQAHMHRVGGPTVWGV